MNKLVVFDFNCTLFDPEANTLVPSAHTVLSDLKARGYILVLLAQASPMREQTIANLGLGEYFAEVLLVERKVRGTLESLAGKYGADKTTAFVVGDRARKEIYLGHLAGWRTVWLRRGRFAGEAPYAGHQPGHTVTDLNQIIQIL